MGRMIRKNEKDTPTMTSEKLLRELEKLSYPARMRRMVEVGRSAAEDKSVVNTLATLERGNFYERQLSLQACFGSRDGEHVLRALNDPSRLIRGLAVYILPHVCSAEQVGSALHAASPDLRRALVKRTYRLYPQVVDSTLERLGEADDSHFVALLPYGSRQVMARYAEEILPTLGWSDWPLYARRHPDLVAGWLRSQIPESGRIDTRLVWQVNAALPALTKQAQDTALALVRALAPRIPLAQLPRLSELAYKRPDEVVALVLEQSTPVHLTLDAVVDRISTEHLLALLVRHGEMLRSRFDWFRRLSPEKRLAVYNSQRPAWYNEKGYWAGAEGALGPEIVSLLPREQREWEGRRHLALPSLQTQVAQRLQYAAFLPWSEARSTIDSYLRDPDADVRAAAFVALVTATRYHRSHASEMLEVVRARRHEQDPVRSPVLARMADLPPSIWKAEHLEGLDQVIQHALDAKDLSSATTSSIERLLISLVSFHTEWAGRWLATVLARRTGSGAGAGAASLLGRLGHLAGAVAHMQLMRFAYSSYPGYSQLSDRLSDTDVRRITPYLVPVLRSWETHEYQYELLAFAQSLGRRLRVFDELLEMLERLLRDTRDPQIARGILNLLIEHSPKRADSLIPELLRRDGSLATLQPVYWYMHIHRQDLLTPYLGQKAHKGRFATGKTRFVLPLNSGFYSWTASQQEIFARTLNELITDAADAGESGDIGKSNVSATSAVHALAALPSIPHSRLVELASLQNPDQLLRDFALMALGRLDDTEEAVPILLEALGDERARTAIYALRRAVLGMPPDTVIRLLSAVDPRTVPLTVAKEVIRLVGDLKTDEALRYLLALDAGDAGNTGDTREADGAGEGEAKQGVESGETQRSGELHRDLGIALLRALWNYLEHDEAWRILERAAASPDAAVATMAARTTADRMSPRAQDRLVHLLAHLLGSLEPQVRLQVLQRCTQLPVRDSENMLITRILERLDSDLPDEVTAAARALFATCDEGDEDLVKGAILRLLDRRRTLQATVQALIDRLMFDRRLVSMARGVLDTLQADRLTASLRARLAIEALGPGELPNLLGGLAQSGDLHFDTMNAIAGALPASVNYSDPESLENLESLLANAEDERLRRLALATLTVSAELEGWTEERLARLRARRADPSPLVASAAQFTLPTAEIAAQVPPDERRAENS